MRGERWNVGTAALIAALAAGCGSEVDVDAKGHTTGAGGATTTSSASSGTTSSSASSGVTTGAGGAGAGGMNAGGSGGVGTGGSGGSGGSGGTSGCASDADCVNSPDGPHCDTTTKACVPCVDDSHCPDPAKPHCDTGVHACFACFSDAHCPPPSFCDLGTHTCAGACQCQAGHMCCNGMLCADPQNDPDHCGGCNIACAGGDNATRYCQFGLCHLLCKDGWADCDNDPKNGCEHDLAAKGPCP